MTKKLKHAPRRKKSKQTHYAQNSDGMLLTSREFWHMHLHMTLDHVLAATGDEQLSTNMEEFLNTPDATFVLLMRGDTSFWEGAMNIEHPKPRKPVPDLLKQAAEIVNLPADPPKPSPTEGKS